MEGLNKDIWHAFVDSFVSWPLAESSAQAQHYRRQRSTPELPNSGTGFESTVESPNAPSIPMAFWLCE
jgi:hypothetical protein